MCGEPPTRPAQRLLRTHTSADRSPIDASHASHPVSTPITASEVELLQNSQPRQPEVDDAEQVHDGPSHVRASLAYEVCSTPARTDPLIGCYSIAGTARDAHGRGRGF